MVCQILSFKEMTLVTRYLVVLMSGKQLLRLLVTQLLTQGGQQVAQLGGADETVPILRLIFLIFWKSRLFSKFMSVSDIPCQNAWGLQWSHHWCQWIVGNKLPKNICTKIQKLLASSFVWIHLHDREEDLEGDPVVGSVFYHKLLYLAFGRVLGKNFGVL